MQEIFFFLNAPKNENQNFEKEKEREITFCEWENYVQNERERGIRKAKNNEDKKSWEMKRYNNKLGN